VPRDFFEKPSDHSLVKTAIVVDYFKAWAKIIGRRSTKIGYVDLYSGPGVYDSGDKSTPILILEHAIDNDDLRKKLVTVFNDVDEQAAASLRKAISELPGVDALAYYPQVFCGPVDETLAKEMEEMSMIPSLCFIDPWGYKGLSSKLLHAAIKDWGSEAIFFFNYNRINPGLSNRLVESHMEAIFGEDLLTQLKNELHRLSPPDRERAIKVALAQAVNPRGDRYVIPFRFLRETNRTSHYIIFVTKHELGYRIMKQVMASHGIVDQDGVPLFEYYPPVSGRQLSFRDRPLLDLKKDLLQHFQGRVLTFAEVVEEHHVGRPFLEKHYRAVLLELERDGIIKCNPSQRRSGTLARKVSITFPG